MSVCVCSGPCGGGLHTFCCRGGPLPRRVHRCGLFVVSTCVGGLPEILPPDMLELVQPRADALTEALLRSVDSISAEAPM